MSKIKFYPSPFHRNEGYTKDEIMSGEIWLYADVTCRECGKNQAWSNLRAGCCFACGERIDG